MRRQLPLVTPPASRSPQYVARARAPAPLPDAMPASVSNRKPAISIVEMARLDRIGAVPNLNRDRRAPPRRGLRPLERPRGERLAAVALVVAFAITLGARLSAPPAPVRPRSRRLRHAVVFDAGSTGNRVHVFEFAASSSTSSIGALANEVFRAETPGFGAFASDPDAAAAMLDPLIETARAAVGAPPPAHAPDPARDRGAPFAPGGPRGRRRDPRRGARQARGHRVPRPPRSRHPPRRRGRGRVRVDRGQLPPRKRRRDARGRRRRRSVGRVRGEEGGGGRIARRVGGVFVRRDRRRRRPRRRERADLVRGGRRRR